jgi:hypothetical protein
VVGGGRCCLCHVVSRNVRLIRVKNIGKRYPADYGKYSPEILHIIAQKHDFDQIHGK